VPTITAFVGGHEKESPPVAPNSMTAREADTIAKP
jgi:hypothetical protein